MNEYLTRGKKDTTNLQKNFLIKKNKIILLYLN